MTDVGVVQGGDEDCQIPVQDIISIKEAGHFLVENHDAACADVADGAVSLLAVSNLFGLVFLGTRQGEPHAARAFSGSPRCYPREHYAARAFSGENTIRPAPPPARCSRCVV